MKPAKTIQTDSTRISSTENLDKYYKSRIHAASIIFVRPLPPSETTNDGFNYKLLFMKRALGIIFGGFFAFSGGKVEEQDQHENWIENYP